MQIAAITACLAAGRRPLGQHNRRVAPTLKDYKAASRSRYFAEMKAHFEDVSA